jgi:peptide deformylase
MPGLVKGAELAVRPILELPHPALRRRARKVRKIDSPVLRLAHDMVDTMREAGGIGLAANQVGALQRVIVIQLPEEEEAAIYINPEIAHREGERKVEEGCLSIPGYKGLITRSLWVKFRALDHTAKVVRLKADELLSQALEHEVDHLNGILYVDHLDSHEKLMKLEPQPEGDDQEGGDPSGNSRRVGEVLVTVPRSADTPASLKVR